MGGGLFDTETAPGRSQGGLGCFSIASQFQLPLVSSRSDFASCGCAVSGALCHCLHLLADAAVFFTPVAITGQQVRCQGVEGISVECAVARVCSEASARVSLHVHVCDLDLPPLVRVESPDIGAESCHFSTERTWTQQWCLPSDYPELSGEHGRARLIVLTRDARQAAGGLPGHRVS